MKDRPYVYVVLNVYGIVVAAFYEKSAAVHWCQAQVAEHLGDPRDWDDYFEIQGIQCN